VVENNLPDCPEHYKGLTHWLFLFLARPLIFAIRQVTVLSLHPALVGTTLPAPSTYKNATKYCGTTQRKHTILQPTLYVACGFMLFYYPGRQFPGMPEVFAFFILNQIPGL